MKKQLSKNDVKELNKHIYESYALSEAIKKKSLAEQVGDVIFVEHRPYWFWKNKILLPTLQFLQVNPILKKVVVDMGAVRFVVSGADIFRPGICSWDPNIKKGMIVVVVDENNSKPLAVGELLVDADYLIIMKSGSAIKNLHWVGDMIWAAKV